VTVNPGVVNVGFPRRWAEYCRERFPLARHGIVIAAFVFATLAVARAGADRAGPPSPWPFAIGFALALLAFLELRILDEFKDAKDDARYRPYRPVPRGLVSLRELRAVGAAAVAFQLALAALAGRAAFIALLIALAWMALMGREFFISGWLRARPLAYVASHTVVVPLIALVVAACSGPAPDVVALAPFLALAYASSMVFEFGRKIRAPNDEQLGVETYSALWGPRIAASVWWMTLAVSALLAIAAVPAAEDPRPQAALSALATAVAAALALYFAASPTKHASKWIEALSGLWLVGAYAALGIVALSAPR
jgi:4-hydroxybenzoate polyprenyltransferase